MGRVNPLYFIQTAKEVVMMNEGGPDVTARIESAWTDAVARFNALPLGKKADNCRMLIQPLISASDAGGSAACQKVPFLPGCLNANARAQPSCPPAPIEFSRKRQAAQYRNLPIRHSGPGIHVAIP